MTLFKKTANRYFAFGRNPVPGQTGVKGTITAISEPRQAMTYVPEPLRKNGVKPEPDFWDKEKKRPVEEIVIDLQTELNEPSEDGTADDGLRKLVVKVDRKPGGKMAAIQDAIFATGADDIEVGGFLALWFTGLDPQSANPDNPRKLFQANYQRPAAAGGAFQQQEQQAPPAPNPYQQPQQGNPYPSAAAAYPPAAPTPPPAPAPPAMDPGPAAAPGMDPWNPGQPMPPQPAAQSYPAPQPAAPATVQVDVAAVQKAIADGLTDGDIANSTGASLEVISALRNLR